MGSDGKNSRPKILLVDDDQDFLELYWEILKQLPSAPEVHTASNGPRALALLESEPFRLLIVDLNMPKMDGLQVIAIARRKYPRLRIVVWTSIMDEQYRARAYALGVDQFCQKPATDDERRHLLDSVETLLHNEWQTGFRGVQSKSLVDLIQLECLSQNSTCLRIANGANTGVIWIRNGEVIDAEAGDLKGEQAFRKILGWNSGSFEIMPDNTEHPRSIFSSYHALLLEMAQALDEAAHREGIVGPADASPIVALTKFDNVQWVLTVGKGPDCPVTSWGLESPDQVSEWTSESLKAFAELGEQLQAGPLQQVIALSSDAHVGFAQSQSGQLSVGFKPILRSHDVREQMRNIIAKWAS